MLRAGLFVLALLPLLLCCGGADAGSRTAVPAWTIVVENDRGVDVLTADRPRPHALARGLRGSPFLSPDGRRLALAGQGLWVVSLGGGAPRRLARGYIDDLDWARDGSTIVFSRNRGEPGAGIFAVDSHGGQVRRLFPAGGFPRWSPDGRRLLCMCGRGLAIWVFDSDGGRRIRLTRNLGVMTNASWTPDGRLIAYGRGCFTVAGHDTWCDLTLVDPTTRVRRKVPRATYLAGLPPTWATAESVLLPYQGRNRRIGGPSTFEVDVKTGTKRFFYKDSGAIYASPSRTAFVVLGSDHLTVLDSFGRVLARRKLAIDGAADAELGELDLHVR